MNRSVLALMAVLSVGIFSASVHPAIAQPAKKTPPKTATKTYYICAQSKTYYTEAAAKKMGYKDAMGHKLTKATSIPKGYTDGSKAKTGGKMDSKSKM